MDPFLPALADPLALRLKVRKRDASSGFARLTAGGGTSLCEKRRPP